MTHEITLLLTISLIIWISPFISKLIRLPIAPVEIILGSVLGFVGLIYPHEYFDIISEVGFLYLMFLAGMEVNLKQITGISKSILQASVLFIVSLGVLSVISGVIFDLDPIVIISLPLISIGLVVSLTKNYSKDEKWIILALTIGVIGEMASITALTILDAISTTGFGKQLFAELGYLFIFIFSTYIIYKLLQILFWWRPEIKNILMPKSDTSDQDIRLSMALFFLFIVFMLSLHLELALGTFIAGVAISAFFHHKKELEEKMSSLGFGFLIPLFFIHVGASFDLNSLTYGNVIGGAFLITFLMIAIRVLSAFFLRKIYTRLDALKTSLALSMPLTLIVAVATIGYDAHLIDVIVYYQMLLASLLEVIISMILIKILNNTKYGIKEKNDSYSES